MNYNIISISTRRFLTIWILVILVAITLFLMLVNTNVGVSKLSFFIAYIVFFAFGLWIALSFSKKKLKISLTEGFIEFGNNKIRLGDILGYYINKESPIMVQIEFKVTGQNYEFTSVKFGEKGKEFDQFITDFIERANKANLEIKELSYYDFHPKQYKNLNRTIYIDFGVILMINIVYLFLVLFHGFPFNWKILLLNIIFIWLYKYHTRNKRRYRENQNN